MAIINTLGGTSIPDLTSPADAADLRSGKQLVDANGDIITGTMPNVNKANPVITISSGGLITSTYTQSTSGYTTSGTTRRTKQITSTDIPTLKPENIKDGVSILGINGSYKGYIIQYLTSSSEHLNTKDNIITFNVPGEWDYINYFGDAQKTNGTKCKYMGFAGALVNNGGYCLVEGNNSAYIGHNVTRTSGWTIITGRFLFTDVSNVINMHVLALSPYS